MIDILIGFLFGTALGSFVLCMADRSVTQQSFSGRSHCDHCQHQLHWYDLIPIVSYLLTSGKCRYCHKPMGTQYLLIELLMGLLVALLFLVQYPQGLVQSFMQFPSLTTFVLSGALLQLLDTIFKAFVLCVLVAVFITDMRTGLIPDRITYPTVVIAAGYLVLTSFYRLGLYYNLAQQSQLGPYFLKDPAYILNRVQLSFDPLISGLLGALVLGLFFGGLIFITKGRGMGGGDLKLGIFMGLALGLIPSILAVFIAFLSGSIVGVFLLLGGKKRFGQTIPFGPFLSLGMLIVLFWGKQIVDWYLKDVL